jgi:hypothetical protein
LLDRLERWSVTDAIELIHAACAAPDTA